MPATFSRTALRTATLFACCACASSSPGTVWPPRDWYLEVKSGAMTERGYEARQCFQAWGDGLGLYREAEGESGDVPPPWPAVWSRASAWYMGPESTRLLARLVHGAGLQDAPGESGTTAATPGPVTAVYLRAWGEEHHLVVRDRASVQLSRVLHVVNSFLPEGESITMPEMTGDIVERHLTRVPLPKTSRQEALELHESLFGREPGTDGFLIDTFALALALGDRVRAEQMLSRISTIESKRAVDLDPALNRESLTTLLREQLNK